jgi:hypothetical protein
VDPTATLALLRQAAQQFDAARDVDPEDHGYGASAAMVEERAREDALDAAQRLADGFQALDRWLAAGGFLPEVWRDAQQGFAERSCSL